MSDTVTFEQIFEWIRQVVEKFPAEFLPEVPSEGA